MASMLHLHLSLAGVRDARAAYGRYASAEASHPRRCRPSWTTSAKEKIDLPSASRVRSLRAGVSRSGIPSFPVGYTLAEYPFEVDPRSGGNVREPTELHRLGAGATAARDPVQATRNSAAPAKQIPRSFNVMPSRPTSRIFDRSLADRGHPDRSLCRTLWRRLRQSPCRAVAKGMCRSSRRSESILGRSRRTVRATAMDSGRCVGHPLEGTPFNPYHLVCVL